VFKIATKRNMDKLWPIVGKYEVVPYLCSKVVSRVKIGRFHGRLYCDKIAQDTIGSIIKPFDIILHSQPHMLSDSLIPGFFTHTALYLGPLATLEQLHDLNKRSDICSMTVPLTLEAYHKGVGFRHLSEFIDCDSFLIARVPGLTLQLKADICNRLRIELDKKYEFGFKLNNPNRQYCVKLIIELFRHLPLVKLRAQPLIFLPDHLCEIVINNDCDLFETVFYYHRGRQIPKHLHSQMIREQMAVTGSV